MVITEEGTIEKGDLQLLIRRHWTVKASAVKVRLSSDGSNSLSGLKDQLVVAKGDADVEVTS